MHQHMSATKLKRTYVRCTGGKPVRGVRRGAPIVSNLPGSVAVSILLCLKLGEDRAGDGADAGAAPSLERIELKADRIPSIPRVDVMSTGGAAAMIVLKLPNVEMIIFWLSPGEDPGLRRSGRLYLVLLSACTCVLP
jgi:hypothetical protein